MSTPTTPPTPPDPPTARRRSPRGPLLLVAALGAVVALGAGAPTWVEGRVATATGTTAVLATGRDAAPVATALALVSLAAVVASTLGRRVARLVAALVLVAGGAGVLAASTGPLREPATALSAPARAASGTTQARVQAGTDVAPWPVVSAAGGGLVAVAGAGLVLGARRREDPRASDRYARDARSGAPAPAHQDPAAAWDALSHGEDPTR
ncbi:Trp biosynthesis-associated membrane protein [Kineococcus sp. LSe6-4]|uniref:Trp biosynthesis-associated membrane protein n=1 Tax=Kineococcus halophytocola TaxID=3234027 RepID=A0ABV4GWF0_9ACTN